MQAKIYSDQHRYLTGITAWKYETTSLQEVDRHGGDARREPQDFRARMSQLKNTRR
jgi:hypothetical protein